MANSKITLPQLRRLIREEAKAQAVHAARAAVSAAASKLLAAIEAFKDKATPAAINAVTPHLGELERALEQMNSTPDAYIVKPKAEPRVVSLKAVKDD